MLLWLVWSPFNPIWCGGGEKHPPSHTFAIPRKKLMGKVANFFLLFLNMRMEGWGLLFSVRLHLVWSGGGQSGQTCLNFIRGDPVGSSRKGKWLTKIGDQLYMLHATFWLFFCWNILVLARYEVGNHFWGNRSANVDIKRVGCFSPPPPLLTKSPDPRTRQG